MFVLLDGSLLATRFKLYASASDLIGLTMNLIKKKSSRAQQQNDNNNQQSGSKLIKVMGKDFAAPVINVDFSVDLVRTRWNIHTLNMKAL